MLNPEQKKAVTHGQGPLLIIAGAGTGKTKVIIERIAYLISSKKAKPEDILALTFTDKAAEEMEIRVDQLVPYGYIDVAISTFHSFGDRVLRDYAIELGLGPDYRVLSLPEQLVFLREHLFELPLKQFKSLGNPTKHLEALVKVISRAQDEAISPREYLQWARQAKDKEQLEVAKVYDKYQKLKLKKGFVDFSDQVGLVLHLFRKKPKILKEFQKKYKYILVDEFQDTNYAQFELLKLLAGKRANLTVVGDDDQCLPGETNILVRGGRKKIRDIKIGEEVVAAVGRGNVSFAPVKKVMKNKKHCRLITLKTESGKSITATSNHKMFCYVPNKPTIKDVYYVYLMYRTGLGWRMGVTNDLVTRLKLERSADYVIGLRGFHTEELARYHEVLWSLEYGIPTVCFQTRERIVIKEELLQALYKEIDTEIGAKRLAYDFDIDLGAHHFCLGAVKRGGKARVKILLELCQRKYRSKGGRNKILIKPQVRHQLSLETSDPRVLGLLKDFNIAYTRSKNGIRVRVVSQDLAKLGELASKLEVLTGARLEARFRLGALNKRHRPALVMPAGNILLGHYLPVLINNKVVYERVTDIKSEIKKITTYDLEIDRAHNFVADNVVVHNSIYKFRGAAISNILNFEKAFRKTKKVVLIRNYRSSQIILDMAHRLIKFNNPDRLEVKAKIDKKLRAAKKLPNKAIEHFHFDRIGSEADWVAQTIKKKYEDGKQYRDFAILVRSNKDAEHFEQALRVNSLPYQFSGAGGLYFAPEVQLLIAFLKTIGDLSDSMALFHLAGSQIYQLNPLDLQKMNTFAKRR
ncbi:MAG: UvrD-helicase domain-containing protein, partial [bacterium]